MNFNLFFTDEAVKKLSDIQTSNPNTYRKIIEMLGNLETDLRHPELETYRCQNLKGPQSQTLYETSTNGLDLGIFWYHPSGESNLVITDII